MSLAPMSRPLLLVTALVILGGTQAGDAAPDGSRTWGERGERRQTMLRQQAEAISRLSSSQRQEYFTQLERLEQRRSSEHLQQLSETRRCMTQARDLSAIETCQRAQQERRKQQGRELKAAMAELRQRYGLPGWEGRRRGGQQGTQGA